MNHDSHTRPEPATAATAVGQQHPTAAPRLSIKQWDEADRPREKLARLGASALSKAELLAILVGSGNARESAVELMRRVLANCNDNLNTLGKLSIEELCRYNGIGEAKAITILAACELGHRRSLDGLEPRPRMDSSARIYAYFSSTSLRDQPVEECHVMLLNHDLRLIGTRLVSKGGIDATAVDVRRVLREAILAGATHIALCHNHPSGCTRPSGADDLLTQSLKQAAGTVNIPLIDHIILADGAYYSYHDEGKI